MSAQVGVIQFPGTNCEMDAVHACEVLGASAELLWHRESSPISVDAVIVPGGFAHGDYLRTGAIARFSPVMDALQAFAQAGGPVVGICNGFQILCEAAMLPGALQKNAGMKFRCEMSTMVVASQRSVLTADVELGTELRIPINHFEGNYTCDSATLERLRSEDRIVLRYLENPNGSLDDIAGVCNDAGNVVGLMPHPERACEPILGSTDGAVLLGSMLRHALTSASS